MTLRSASFTILGEPASKANSRKIVTIGKGDKARAAVIKSDKALNYVDSALKQIPPEARLRMDLPVFVTMRIYYATERPDLDESVILDVMQDQYRKPKGSTQRQLVQHGVYQNDRQVRGKYVTHHIDRENPRAEIVVEEMEPPPKPPKVSKAERKRATKVDNQPCLI